jgi:integrase
VCLTKSLARERLREFIERAGINSNYILHQRTAPGTKFEQQAEWWIGGLTTRRRRPPKPATVYSWHHCLDKWILPNLGKKLVSEVGNGALRQFVETLSAAGLAAKTMINIVAVVKLVVASAVNEEGDEIYPRTWNYEFIQLPLVVKEKQNRPTITDVEISAVLSSVRKRYAVMFALLAGTGLRIGEALAVRTTDFAPGCRVLHIRRSVWRRCEQEPKTASAVRLVDIAEPLALVLCRYTTGLDGHLFTNLNGGLLDQRNVLDALHKVGKRGGFHVFRRFRFALLRKAGVPEHLIKLWLGHSQDLTDRYAAQLYEDVAYRREWCERAGLGFELGELGYKGLFAIRSSQVAQTYRETGFRIGCGGWI